MLNAWIYKQLLPKIIFNLFYVHHDKAYRGDIEEGEGGLQEEVEWRELIQTIGQTTKSHTPTTS